MYFKILFIFISVFLVSCNKEIPPKQNSESQRNSEQEENGTDTVMTAEESFSSALAEDILGENDDIDLQLYLEEQIYPVVSKSGKVTIDRISSSVYMLTYEEGGSLKNLLIRKFYNPSKDEFIFEKTETQTDAMKQFLK